MVPVFTIIACIITLLISLFLPVAALLLLASRYKNNSIVPAWLMGAAGFFVTQILIRVPILMVLQSQSWFLSFSQNHLFLYAFSLAFTAGLFELAGRFCVARLLQKRGLSFHRSLAAGLGHGGIEAIVLVGFTYITNLVYIFMIHSGSFDAMVTQTAAMGVDVTQLEMLRAQLTDTSPVLFLLGGFERMLAMTAHAAMSLLVCYGVAHRKPLPCVLVCLLIHTFIDLTAGLTLVLPQTTAYVIIYAILTAVAAASLLIIRELCRRWNETEVSHDSEE